MVMIEGLGGGEAEAANLARGDNERGITRFFPLLFWFVCWEKDEDEGDA